MKLPKKFSKWWFLFALLIFAVVIGAFLYVPWTLGSEITMENIQGFALLGGIVALVLAGGGFFGGRVFFVLGLLVNLFGLGYMIYLAMARTAQGWSDLASIMSYLFLASLGILLGIIGQLIASIRRVGKEQKIKK